MTHRLRRWTRHDQTCKAWQSVTEDCTCGLTDAIEAEAQPAPDALLREALDAHDWRLGWRDEEGVDLWGCSCGWSTRYPIGEGDRMWRNHREQAIRAALAVTPPASALTEAAKAVAESRLTNWPTTPPETWRGRKVFVDAEALDALEEAIK